MNDEDFAVLGVALNIQIVYEWTYIDNYSDVIMGTMASQITGLTIVYSTVYSGADQRKHQSSASLAFVRGVHRWPVDSPHKWPVMRKMFPFDDVIMSGLALYVPVLYRNGTQTRSYLSISTALGHQHSQCFLKCYAIVLKYSWLSIWKYPSLRRESNSNGQRDRNLTSVKYTLRRARFLSMTGQCFSKWRKHAICISWDFPKQ